MDEITAVKKLILNKLTRARMWGGKHTPLDFVLKGLPMQFRMTHVGGKAVQKALKELENDQWVSLMQKRTGKGYDTHVSLNSRKHAEIQSFLANHHI